MFSEVSPVPAMIAGVGYGNVWMSIREVAMRFCRRLLGLLGSLFQVFWDGGGFTDSDVCLKQQVILQICVYTQSNANKSIISANVSVGLKTVKECFAQCLICAEVFVTDMKNEKT